MNTAEIQHLVEVAAEHERDKPESAPAMPDLVSEAMERLIASAEEEAPEPAAPVKRYACPILCGNGWPERYVIEEGEPEGGDWKAAFAVATPILETGGLLILHGKRGTGKTRMASELARAGRFPFDQTRGKKLTGAAPEQRRTSTYRTAMRFFLDLRATFRKDSKDSERDVIDALAEPGLLVIDELQERGDTAFEDRLLTHLIDARYGAMRPTILIANLDSKDLGAALGPSIVDRAHENGRRIDFTWDSYRRVKR